MLDEPVAGGTAGRSKVFNIGIEMAAAPQRELLRLERPAVCRDGLIGHRQMIGRRDHHQERRR